MTPRAWLTSEDRPAWWQRVRYANLEAWVNAALTCALVILTLRLAWVLAVALGSVQPLVLLLLGVGLGTRLGARR